jgi:hypothetical protein
LRLSGSAEMSEADETSSQFMLCGREGTSGKVMYSFSPSLPCTLMGGTCDYSRVAPGCVEAEQKVLDLGHRTDSL